MIYFGVPHFFHRDTKLFLFFAFPVMADDDDVAIESEIYHQMKEQNASKMFQLETLFSQLKVSSSEVLACWLVGSRSVFFFSFFLSFFKHRFIEIVF